MLGKNVVDDELKRGLGVSMKEIEPFLSAGGGAAEMKFMECCRYLWQADGVELIEPFIEAAFNKLPERSRCVLFQRMLTIVYLAQDAQKSQTNEVVELAMCFCNSMDAGRASNVLDQHPERRINPCYDERRALSGLAG
jgi:hypothetical protein